MKTSFIFLAVLLITACSPPKKESSETPATTINELPPLMLAMSTGENVMVNSLPGNTILIFFSPDCDHCQREAEAIQKRLDAFRNYKLYFIAASLAEDIKTFAEHYHLAGYPNVLFARAEIPDVIRIMGPLGTPSLFIYSGEKRLVKKFDGETDVDEIIKFL